MGNHIHAIAEARRAGFGREMMPADRHISKLLFD